MPTLADSNNIVLHSGRWCCKCSSLPTSFHMAGHWGCCNTGHPGQAVWQVAMHGRLWRTLCSVSSLYALRARAAASRPGSVAAARLHSSAGMSMRRSSFLRIDVPTAYGRWYRACGTPGSTQSNEQTGPYECKTHQLWTRASLDPKLLYDLSRELHRSYLVVRISAGCAPCAQCVAMVVRAKYPCCISAGQNLWQ